VGALPPGKKAEDVSHHSPNFMIDESSFVYGVRALCYLTVNYMEKHAEVKSKN
jgi:amidohydrolase